MRVMIYFHNLCIAVWWNIHTAIEQEKAIVNGKFINLTMRDRTFFYYQDKYIHHDKRSQIYNQKEFHC